MHRPLLILALALALAVVAGCGQVSSEDRATPTTSARGSEATPTTTTLAAPGVTTGATPAPPTQVPATTAHATASTVRPATTTTARPLTRAEATSRLCAAVAEADRRIQSGSFVAGGLRLSGGIAANEKAADAAVVAAARSMLAAGLHGDPQGYVTARSTASTACARAGYPIQLSGPIMCIRAPCP